MSATHYEHDLRILRDLQEYLDVRDKPDDDLIELEDLALPGSASWYLKRSTFREWRDGPLYKTLSPASPSYPENLKMLWLNAMPGVGKSVLTSQIINHLEALNLDCCYYFFSLEARSKSTVSGLLRSIAYQMALLNPHVRQKLLRLKESGVQLDNNKEKLIWRKLFVAGIFTCRVDQPQYWIIDALDECRDFDNLLTMLSKIEAVFPLRIFITSRPLPHIKNKMLALGSRVWEHNFGVDDIRHNIRRYIEDGPHSHILSRVSAVRRRDLTEKILDKSEGCFLWVELVMQELEKHGYSTEGVERILDQVPPGMDRLYTRTISEIMETDEEGRKVAEAILSIVVCAIHPLTVAELANALKIHLRINLLEHTIKSSCGNLIYVDKGGHVCLVHQTARDYLLKHGLYEAFKTNSTNAHQSLAIICLEYLRSTQMRPVRMLASPGPSTVRINRRLQSSPFAQYACMHFSDHLRRSSSDDDILLDSVYRFLTTNGLSWVEHVAASDKLSVLVLASQNLRGFLQARAKHKPLIDKKSQCIQRWSIDLIRIVAKFGKHLVRLPQSIYGLIPPLAPRESAIVSQYDSRRGIDILGISNASWDDRLCGISFHGKTATAVACGESTFAVGLNNGAVFIYDNATFQELRSFQHQEAIKILHYSSTGDLLVSAGMRRVKLWNVFEGLNIWEEKTTAEPLALTFTNEDRNIVGITRNNILVVRDTANGRPLKRIVRKYPSGRGINLFQGGDIECASFDVASKMLATVHRGHPIVLSDLDTDEELGQCEPDMGADTFDLDPVEVLEPAMAVEFCPNSDINLLAVVYRDGALATFDPSAQVLVEKVHDFEVEKLSCSPDGRTLAVGDSSGMILLYETETLRLLYRIIHKSNLAIRTIAFSADSKRLIDIRESQCNVWEPPVLMRTEPQETESMSDMLPTHDDNLGTDKDVVEITSIASTACGEFIICGMDNGWVVLYETDTGERMQLLYEHATGSWISQINISIRAIASIGGTNELVVKRYPTENSWTCEGLLHLHYSEPIRQMLFDRIGSRLLVALNGSVIQYDLATDGASRRFHDTPDAMWANDPTNADRIFAIQHNMVTLHSWDDLSALSTLGKADICLMEESQLSVRHVADISGKQDLGIVLSSSGKRIVNTLTLVLDCSSFSTDGDALQAFEPVVLSISTKVEHIIGVQGNKLYFLDKDLWVCSVALGTKGAKCAHHMFIPDEWLKANNRPLLLLTAKGKLVLVKRDEVIVIKRPFTYSTNF